MPLLAHVAYVFAVCMPTLLLEVVVVYELVMLTSRGPYSVPLPYPAQPTMPMTMFSQPNLFPANTISAAIPANAVQPPEDGRQRLLDGPVIAGLGYAPEHNRPRIPIDGPVVAGMGYSPDGSRPRVSHDDGLIPGFGGLSLSGETSNRYPTYSSNQKDEEEGVNH